MGQSQTLDAPANYDGHDRRENADTYIVVGAIDFGTSYSGYAFSFKSDPQKVFTKVWPGDVNLSSSKTPTCILFDKDMNFKAFGFQAEDKYADCYSDGEHHDWYFFRNYKMALYGTMAVSKKQTFDDVQGRPAPLFTLVTETIKYLKNELLSHCKNNLLEIRDTDIKWVLTVPAIWTDSAKNFMRKAAENAGIPSDSLSICLEPEAAAVFCRTVPCKISAISSTPDLVNFQKGDSYLLLDAGGGTVDIIVHEVGDNGELKEIHPACGGDWGGTLVDRAFLDFLKDLVGNKALEDFCRTEITDFQDLMREFESKKRNLGRQHGNTKIKLRIPQPLQSPLRKALESEVLQSNSKMSLELKGDKLFLSFDKMLEFFDCSEQSIKKYVCDLFRKCQPYDVKNIIMVGGLSESLPLQNFLREVFNQKSFIIPMEAGLAVLKGAVLFGYDLSVIRERRCRFTYGIRCNMNYDPSIHAASTKYIDEFGTCKVKNGFDIHVNVGQNIRTGGFQPAQSYLPETLEQKSAIYSLYACPRPNPVYVTELDCIKIGEMEIDRSDLKGKIENKSILVALCFSGTEITIRATKKQTGEVLSAKIVYDW